MEELPENQDIVLLDSESEMGPEEEELVIEAEISPANESEEYFRDVEDRMRRSVQQKMRQSIVRADAVPSIDPKHGLSSLQKRRYYCRGLAVTLLCGGVIGGVLAAVLKPSPSPGLRITIAPSSQPSHSPHPSSQPSLEPTTIDQSRLEAFRSILEALSGGSLFETSTDAFQALEWIASVDPGQLNPDDLDARLDIVERYALALLYFSTGGPGWLDQRDFLNAASVCDWIAVNCTEGRVAKIFLGENRLIGTIPFYEMGALSELGKFHLCMLMKALSCIK